MVMCLLVFMCFSDCVPKELVLRNGEILNPDCGWSIRDEQVLVRFKNHHFFIQKTWVDWQETRKLVAPSSNTTPQTQENEAWSRLISKATPKDANQPVVLDNELLQDYLDHGELTVTRKKEPSKQTMARTDYLKNLILQLESQRNNLKQQLDADVTWQQAKFLMAQIDRLEQMLKEHRYWLRRLTEENTRKNLQRKRAVAISATHQPKADPASPPATPRQQWP